MAGRGPVVVFGATGAQGGSVVRALLAEGSGEVRAVTRRPGSAAAAQVRQLGARVVAADLDDGRTLEPALAGAYGAFVVTDFWNHCSREREVEQVAPCRRGPGAWQRCGRAAAGRGCSRSSSCSLASPAGSGLRSAAVTGLCKWIGSRFLQSQNSFPAPTLSHAEMP